MIYTLQTLLDPSLKFRVNHVRVRTYHKVQQARVRRPPPRKIKATTSDTRYLSDAHRYANDAELVEAHNAELDKLEKLNAIEPMRDHLIPKDVKLIFLTMDYKYKRSVDGDVAKRKAPCSLLVDTMLKQIQYEPENTATYAANKTKYRAVIAVSKHRRQPLRHIDFFSTLEAERYDQPTPVYVKRMFRLDVSYNDPTSTFG